MDCSMKAYLDDFGKINVLVSHRFYNGKTTSFYIKNEDKEYTDCLIRNIEDRSDYTLYELVIHSEYDFSKEYYIVEAHGHSCPVEVRHVVNNPKFDERFAYDGNDLGSTYYPTHTSFALWAPTSTAVNVCIYGNKTQIHPMVRDTKGVYRAVIKGDFDGCRYKYLVKVNGQYIEALDPYALSGTSNGTYSAIINLNKVIGKSKHSLPSFKSYTDAIIYELSIRDFTSNINTNTKTHSLFVSLCEEDTVYDGLPTGLNYLQSLGITHVQLMPVFDFVTVDESNPSKIYNWGYDPLQYGVLEGSYSTNPNDPYSRINEFKQLVNTLHDKGIRVNLDVVFNHHYDLTFSSLNRIVPYYYFRYNGSGYLSNGSFCGNDTESRHFMMRKYMIDMCKRFVSFYDIDGLRFDLMGIHDVTTINMIKDAVFALKSDFMVYGEGWNMPTSINDEDKAMIGNNYKMPDIAFFNDVFRDVIKGKTSQNEAYSKGYMSGDTGLIFDGFSAMNGSCIDGYHKIYLTPSQSINYVECHDNATSWDKLKDCCKDEVNEIRVLRQKMLLASVMLAQGVPFIQSGQEFCRTKLGLHNTYNSPDNINNIDWARRSKYEKVTKYFKDLVKIRKKYPEFRMNDVEEIKAKVEFANIKGMMMYEIHGETEIICLFNPTSVAIDVGLKDIAKVIFDKRGLIKQPYVVTEISVEPYSVKILVR